MNTVLPARRKDLEELKKPGSVRQDCDSLDLQRRAPMCFRKFSRKTTSRRDRAFGIKFKLREIMSMNNVGDLIELIHAKQGVAP